MLLNATQVRKLKPEEKPFKLADGGGLHLYVTPKGSKLWRLRYRFEGKEKQLSLGKYLIFIVARAIELCIEVKRKLPFGIGPRSKAFWPEMRHSRCFTYYN